MVFGLEAAPIAALPESKTKISQVISMKNDVKSTKLKNYFLTKMQSGLCLFIYSYYFILAINLLKGILT